jgi:hypothetical protein
MFEIPRFVPGGDIPGQPLHRGRGEGGNGKRGGVGREKMGQHGRSKRPQFLTPSTSPDSIFIGVPWYAIYELQCPFAAAAQTFFGICGFTKAESGEVGKCC